MIDWRAPTVHRQQVERRVRHWPIERENSPATGIVNGVLFMCAFVGIPLALLGALFF